MIRCKNFYCLMFGLTCVLLGAASAPAVQFSTLNPAYTQEIYAGPVVGLPGAFTSTGELLGRQSYSQNILEYSLTQNNVHLGTNVHDVVATHTIAGLGTD